MEDKEDLPDKPVEPPVTRPVRAKAAPKRRSRKETTAKPKAIPKTKAKQPASPKARKSRGKTAAATPETKPKRGRPRSENTVPKKKAQPPSEPVPVDQRDELKKLSSLNGFVFFLKIVCFIFFNSMCALVHVYMLCVCKMLQSLSKLSPRLMVENSKYKFEPYWSRCQLGIRHRADGKHTWLGTNPNMLKNIEAANFVAPFQHLKNVATVKHMS